MEYIKFRLVGNRHNEGQEMVSSGVWREKCKGREISTVCTLQRHVYFDFIYQGNGSMKTPMRESSRMRKTLFWLIKLLQ